MQTQPNTYSATTTALRPPFSWSIRSTSDGADGDSRGARGTKGKGNYSTRKDKAQGRLCPAAASLHHLLSCAVLDPFSSLDGVFLPSASTCFSFLNTGTGLRATLSLRTARDYLPDVSRFIFSRPTNFTTTQKLERDSRIEEGRGERG